MQQVKELICSALLAIFYIFLYVFFIASSMYFFYDGILVAHCHAPYVDKNYVMFVSIAFSIVFACLNLSKHKN